MGQSPEDRAHYHPFPFNRWVVGAIFATIVLERHVVGPLVRAFPRLAGLLLVVHTADADSPVGYCTLRFTVGSDRIVRGLFGSFVEPMARGIGAGNALMRGAIEAARGLGMSYLTTTFLESNQVSARFVARWGFTVAPTLPDLRQPHERNFIGELDLARPEHRRPP